MKKKTTSRFKTGIYILIVLLPCMEIAIRLVGGKPYSQDDYSIEISPSSAYEGNDSLGISLVEGNFDIVLNEKIAFSASHLKGNIRYTPRVDTSLPSRQTAVFGCSFTYGYGVNDEENFVSVLQKNNQSIQFTNHGVIGYGTVQSYLQLKNMIAANEVPDEVVLIFSSFHLERNALTPSYKRALKIGFNQSINGIDSLMNGAKFPFVMEDKELKIQYASWDSLYKDWKGRSTFATVNYLQTAWDRIQTDRINSVGISNLIVNETNRLCDSNQIVFKLVLLDNRKEMDDFYNSLGEVDYAIHSVKFDFTDTTLTNLPHDMHPNEKGHRVIAESIQSLFSN